MRNQSVTGFAPKESARNIESYRRENSFWQELALIDLDKGESVASIRFYGANSTVYCVAWFHLHGYGHAAARGMGKAGGYGYHKSSAAMAEALRDAGMRLSESIDGTGDESMVDALKAIAAHVGIARPMIHKSHA